MKNHLFEYFLLKGVLPRFDFIDLDAPSGFIERQPVTLLGLQPCLDYVEAPGNVADHILLNQKIRGSKIEVQRHHVGYRAIGVMRSNSHSSWVQDTPWPDITPYNVTKSGIKMLMRGMARELAAKGIRVNSIAPGIVAVGMAKRQGDTEPDYRRRAEKAIPLGFMQPPESVADAFIFLCSPPSDYMTGATLMVDGGCSLYPMD